MLLGLWSGSSSGLGHCRLVVVVVVQVLWNWHADELLDIPEVVNLGRVAEGDGDSALTSSRSSADTVNVALRLIWQVVVEDV